MIQLSLNHTIIHHIYNDYIYLSLLPSGTTPKEMNQNPATWMLQVIGAGTSSSTTTDFHEYYKSSSLHQINQMFVHTLCSGDHKDNNDNGEDDDDHHHPHELLINMELDYVFHPDSWFQQYDASYSTQFRYLMMRSLLCYWRSPSYNFVRMTVNILLAFIFASAYATTEYTTDAYLIGRVSLIYVSVLFLGTVSTDDDDDDDDQ